MTTSIFRHVARNLFVENDVYCLQQSERHPEFSVAGICWLCETDNVRAAHLCCGEHIIADYFPDSSNLELWLLAGNSAWQDDNRVRRWYKFWKSLRRNGILPPPGKQTNEHLIVSLDGIKWFSAVQFDTPGYPQAMQVVYYEIVSVIAAFPKNSEALVDSIVHKGWERSPHGPPLDILPSIIDGHGLLLWPIGAFDDREAGVAVLGKPEDMDSLMNA